MLGVQLDLCAGVFGLGSQLGMLPGADEIGAHTKAVTGSTALHFAVQGGQATTIELLLSHQANLEAREVTLPEGDFLLLSSRSSLALTIHHMGDIAGARLLS